ncbi:MAG TPA: multicopper oxidase domain-containing protein [Terriglobales bacterium]|jgi:FtsP/CotA-like multicopper oxidase with cupredoxin domain|nr:multicopper oxidase domain-containing protein [Terriglobales bacterium]
MRQFIDSKWKIVVWVAALSFGVVPFCKARSAPDFASGKVRIYYIAADEVEWNYAPDGINKMMGMKFSGYPNVFVEQGPHRIGAVYRKAIYREYTDQTFSKLKPRAPEWEHAGILGPILRAEVGDTIRVVFKNNATHPASVHSHGVFYNKASEGASYDDGTTGDDKADDDVLPGNTHVYSWEVPERAGPGPADPSSLVWLYHSHGNQALESGLIGAIIITARGMARADGKPKDVDREFVNFFMVFDENTSWYLDHNIQAYTSDPKGVNKLEFVPADTNGNLSPTGTGFAAANFKGTINGFLFANGPMMTMKKGERVRWYLLTMGEGANFHTPHWHGNVVLDHGRHTDVLFLGPAQMETVDMVPDNIGIWLYHCHVEEHMDMGMTAMYKVEP